MQNGYPGPIPRSRTLYSRHGLKVSTAETGNGRRGGGMVKDHTKPNGLTRDWLSLVPRRRGVRQRARPYVSIILSNDPPDVRVRKPIIAFLTKYHRDGSGVPIKGRPNKPAIRSRECLVMLHVTAFRQRPRCALIHIVLVNIFAQSYRTAYISRRDI